MRAGSRVHRLRTQIAPPEPRVAPTRMPEPMPEPVPEPVLLQPAASAGPRPSLLQTLLSEARSICIWVPFLSSPPR
jgi:hypothetical protein